MIFEGHNEIARKQNRHFGSTSQLQIVWEKTYSSRAGATSTVTS